MKTDYKRTVNAKNRSLQRKTRRNKRDIHALKALGSVR